MFLIISPRFLLLVGFVGLSAFDASGQTAPGKSKSNEGPRYHRFPALTPAESLRKVHLPPGYRADIVAAEPMIQEPVWAAWDADGALYVAEMNSYMQDIKGTGTKTTRNGRIKRLVDLDGDGIMDRATVFVDHLLLPRMILALDERILIQETDATRLVAYRDTDGDGVADKSEVLYDGPPAFAASVEHQDSALTWNIDNWMYTAQGGLRHRYTDGTWRTERIAEQLSNQWGLGMDDTGMMFYSTNHVPGRYFNQHWYYWNLIGERRNWRRFTFPSLGPETDAAFQITYKAQPIGDRADVNKPGWTSASGLSIFRGDALPPDCYGNMILAEPCGHSVRRATVTRDADGRRTLANPHENAEFFMSEDFYCRPVATHTGPDGCLYIVDMYRGIIQDAPWVSADFARRIQGMGADTVKNRGRIYRISHESKSPGPRPRLLSAKPAELVPHLAHANGWWRDTAQRLLILRGDKSVVGAVRGLARTHGNPLGRLHALWTLEGLGALDAESRGRALRDADYRVRAAAIRLHEPEIRAGRDKATFDAIATAADDPDPEVRRQLMLTLGWSADDRAIRLIQEIAARSPGNSIFTLAALTALHGRTELPLIRQVRDGSAFASIHNADTRGRAEALWRTGLESWSEPVGAANAKPPSPALQALLDKGARAYEQHCVSCHGADGRGVAPPDSPSIAPALAGSPRVTGGKEALARILLHGLSGPVDGRQFELGQMAPLGAALPDDELAAVLSYIRQSWSHSAQPLLPEEIAAIRAATKDRTTPWTLSELSEFAAPRLTDRSRWKATASGHVARNAIDGVTDGTHQHAWHGANNPGAWLAVDLGATHRLTHLELASVDPQWAPRGYTVEVSLDGQAWTTVARCKENVLRSRTIASFEPVEARHVRITQIGNSIERWVVAELEIFGR